MTYTAQAVTGVTIGENSQKSYAITSKVTIQTNETPKKTMQRWDFVVVRGVCVDSSAIRPLSEIRKPLPKIGDYKKGSTVEVKFHTFYIQCA